MNTGINLSTKEEETPWNAFRFANTAIKQGNELKFFLMGEAVECESIQNEHYDVVAQMKTFQELEGEILACGTCLKSRKLEETTSCPISTMVDCVNLVSWADKVVSF